MTPVMPTAPHEGGRLVVFAKTQPEYIPLPASVDANGLVMTEWALSAEDLAAVLNGGRVRLWVWTHGNPLQPVALQVVDATQDTPSGR